MRKKWFEKLQQNDIIKEKVISASDLFPNIYDKTLLFGYTFDRKTFHVYIKNKEIYVVTYYNDFSGVEVKPKNMRQIVVKSNQDYVPDKRLYPERCEYRFCRMLKEKGIELPFTEWNDSVNLDRKYYGFTLEDAK